MTTRFVAPLSLAALASFVLFAQAPRAQTTPAAAITKIHVGILREDAALVPIALFDGKKWTAPWPHEFAVQDPMVPPPLRSVPRAWWGGTGPQLEWELLTASGAQRPVRVLNTLQIQSSCTEGVALTTDYKTRVRIEDPSSREPYAGIVSTVPGQLGLVRAHKRGTPLFAQVTRALPALFHRYGKDAWKEFLVAHELDLSRPVPAPQISVVSSGELPDGRLLVQFSADQITPMTINGEHTEEMVTRLTGWLVQAPGASTLTTLYVHASATDTDGKGGDNTLWPYASLTVAGRTYWIGSAYAYESERYFIIDVTGKTPRRVVSVDAGGC